MEFVFVVPRKALFPECYPHGFTLFGDGLDEEAFYGIVEEHGFFVEREYAERTPSLKQVIPYTIVTRDGEVFLLRRNASGGEARLFNKLSIGVGGHINPVDLPTDGAARRNPIPAATRREVTEEELKIVGTFGVQSAGILNDDSNPVGAVHVGLVQVLTVDGSVAVRETDQLEGKFATLAEIESLHSSGANLETWSSLLIPHLGHLIPGILASSPS
jgi:predicted NUDIX family phosphoesterase